ncbi:DUF6037 family protein [Saccharibacillus alkalitolerans]|uniref:Uncharacterized protein n=1 Tax=Saccharibacillus alkalitolerans TaxID=2705290 RepID=A0ABX0F2X5_9BACL|nr:DUF6037 family protein [Saccharibacillus alkalitolerans]NGZ74299.1 hypothetical protein [Saccharibacillus alkalitolerans]
MRSPLLGNLEKLKRDMEKKGRCVDSFLFEHRKRTYVVLVKLYGESGSRPEQALAELEFLNTANARDRLSVPASRWQFIIDARELRTYFGIDYEENLGEAFRRFYDYFGGFVPLRAAAKKSAEEREAMVAWLSRQDGEEADRVYCCGVRKTPGGQNGIPAERSLFNDNKARLLRPRLHKLLKTERRLSFCFSNDPADERTDDDILKKGRGFLSEL